MCLDSWLQKLILKEFDRLSDESSKQIPLRQVGKEGGGLMAWVGKWILAFLLVVSLGPSTVSLAGTQEEVAEGVRLAFSPYRQGQPRADGLSPGTKLSQSTWQVA